MDVGVQRRLKLPLKEAHLFLELDEVLAHLVDLVMVLVDPGELIFICAQIVFHLVLFTLLRPLTFGEFAPIGGFSVTKSEQWSPETDPRLAPPGEISVDKAWGFVGFGR